MLYIPLIIIIYNVLIIYYVQSQDLKCVKQLDKEKTFFIIEDKNYIVMLSYLIILFTLLNYFLEKWIKIIYKLPIIGNIIVLCVYILVGLHIYITANVIYVINHKCNNYNLAIPLYIYIIIYMITITYFIYM